MSASLGLGMSLGALLFWSYQKYYAGCNGKCVCGSACTCGPQCSCESKSSSKQGDVVSKGCSMNNGKCHSLFVCVSPTSTALQLTQHHIRNLFPTQVAPALVRRRRASALQ